MKTAKEVLYETKKNKQGDLSLVIWDSTIIEAMQQYVKNIKFELQKIALADDEMVNKEGAAIEYREIVREILKQII